MSRLLVALSVVALSLGLASPASACTCTGFTAFDEELRRSPIVVVGRVVAFGPPSDRSLLPDPVSFDLDVTWVAKGVVQQRRIRVWNLWAGTSCGGLLQRVKVGVDVVAPIKLAVAVRRQSPELWDALELTVPPTDFMVAGSCIEDGLRGLQSDEARRRYVGRTIP